MAKVQFQRSKPHVNARATERLSRIGVSRLGALQLLSGQMVASQRDRQLIAELVAGALDAHSRLFTFQLELLADRPGS